jgi:hypothetical protein
MDVIKRDPRGQGDQGELSAIAWLIGIGWPVFLPIGHSPDFDLVTDFGEGLVRVQVKTSSVLRKRPVGGRSLYSGRQPELERAGQVP